MFDYVAEGNMTIFDFMYPTFKIIKPIRLIELFGGVGSQAMAIRDIGADFEHYLLVEYDKYPVASYNAIHGTNFPMMDIREVHGEDLKIVDTDLFTYIMTYSFPCQDLSVAGKMKGMSKGSGTRSGLLWEVERILIELSELKEYELPQVLLMENVPQVISDANIADFRLWQDFLESKGYTNYVEILNAKDFVVAQNRERCFMISLLGPWNYKFHQPIPLTKTMVDYLEDEVDEKYYINSEKAQTLIQQLIDGGQLDNCIGNVNPSGNGMNGNVKSANGLCPTLTTNKGEGQKICTDLSINNPKQTPISNCITARQDRGISNQEGVGGAIIELGKLSSSQDGVVVSIEGISKTLTSGHNNQPKILERSDIS
jgi:DNA (cytosine-5)-methyltransferase 1